MDKCPECRDRLMFIPALRPFDYIFGYLCRRCEIVFYYDHEGE